MQDNAVDEFACPQCGAVIRAQMSDRGVLNLREDEHLIELLANWLRRHAGHLDSAQAAPAFVDFLKGLAALRSFRGRPIEEIDVSATGYL